MSAELELLEDAARSLVDRAVERFVEETVAFRWVAAERAVRVAFAALLLQEGEPDA
jgi:hypothetical protein